MTDFLMAESGIRQLHARYTDAVWRKDYVSFGDCFTADAEWRLAGKVFHGRDEIVEAIGQFMGRYRRVLVTLRTPILELGPGKGEASARTYVTEQSVLNDGRAAGVMGIYHERFVDQKDRWRFTWRLFQTGHAGAPDMTDAVFDNPDYGPPPAMPPPDALV